MLRPRSGLLDLTAIAAEAMGAPAQLLRLEVDADAIRLLRAALLDILDSACFVVDTAEGRLTG